MMINFKRFFVSALFALSVLPMGQTAHAQDSGTVVRTVIAEAIKPAFDAFAQSAIAANQSVEALCAAPSTANVLQAQEGFRALVTSWSHAELFRIGPLTADNRLERILFWPDRRSLGQRQVQTAIYKKDPTVTTLETLSPKSVAMQGLMALEYTLFGKGSDALSGTGGDAEFRCQYATAITQNIVVISAELAKYWSGENAFSKRWLSPSATNPMVRDEIEQLSIVLKIFGDGVEIMKEQRFSPFLKDSQAAARPKAALFWRSNMSIPSLIGGIEMLDHLLANSKLDSLVTGNHKRELSAVRFEFANAKRALERAYANGETDMKTVLANEETYGQLNYAHIVLTGLVSNLRGPIPNMFGIITGFSSLDGD